jgi:hypothetical protein
LFGAGGHYNIAILLSRETDERRRMKDKSLPRCPAFVFRLSSAVQPVYNLSRIAITYSIGEIAVRSGRGF